MELTNLNMSDEELLEINGEWDLDEATVQIAKWTMALITVSA